MWDAQLADFSKHFRILRYDTRGHGQSSVTPGAYSIEQLSHDVLHLLDAFQLSQVSFCGLSMGGMTGMFFGAHDPLDFTRLSSAIPLRKLATRNVDCPHQSGPAGWHESGYECGHRTLVHHFIPHHPRNASKSHALNAGKQQSHGYVSNCAAVRDFDHRESLSAINTATLVLSGTHDPVTTPTDGRFLVERISGSRFVEVPAAHISNIEAQTEFNREVLSFLRA